jgi:hypothetical protein
MSDGSLMTGASPVYLVETCDRMWGRMTSDMKIYDWIWPSRAYESPHMSPPGAWPNVYLYFGGACLGVVGIRALQLAYYQNSIRPLAQTVLLLPTWMYTAWYFTKLYAVGGNSLVGHAVFFPLIVGLISIGSHLAASMLHV